MVCFRKYATVEEALSSRELNGFIMAYLGNARLNIKTRIMTSSPSLIISLNMFPSPPVVWRTF
jgi:hypothetical protein